MLTGIARGLLWLSLVWSTTLLVVAVAPAGADAPSTHVTSIAPLDDFLHQASDFEKQRLWQQAADVYERAFKLYPQRVDVRDRWDKAERLFSLSRRYHDPSFTGDLLSLSDDGVIELYREVLRKILAHYVDNVDLDRLVRLGYRNLEMAVMEPVFVERNWSKSVNTTPPRDPVARFREELADRPARHWRTVDEASDEVRRASQVARRSGALSSAPIALEFLTAACEGLDPYSTHLSPNRLRDLYAMIDGNFVGLGIEVRGEVSGLVIVNVLPSSPAAEAGLRDGDHIEKVDGIVLAGHSAEESANRLQGPIGSIIRLTVRDAEGTRRDLSLTRREVVVHSVTHAQMLDREAGVGYLRINSFQKLTVRELETAIDRLERQGMRALIVDLRGNPGGLLDVALHAANRFVAQGVLVSTHGRAWGQSWLHRARPMDVYAFPLVVLVDGDSASASEIFAGAMQDHERAVIVGSTTYGKGSVQSIFPLRGAMTGLRLTTAHFYSPKGKAFHGVGVMPDVRVSRGVGALGQEVPVPRVVDGKTDIQLAKGIERLKSQLAASAPLDAAPAPLQHPISHPVQAARE